VLIVASGCTSFVGRSLIPHLARRHEVICLVRDEQGLATGDRAIRGDLESGEGLAALPARADAVLHLAQGAGAFPAAAPALFGVNANGTARLLDYASRSGTSRFVFTSTGTVYAPGPGPLAEDAPLAPRPEFYVLTKRVAEELVLAASQGMRTLVVRLFAPYGPGQRDRLIPRLVQAVLDRQPVTLRDGGAPRINPIWIDDLTAILAQATEGTGEGVVNVAGPEAVGIREIAEIAGGALGISPTFVEDPAPAGGDLVADTSRMTAIFAPPSLLRPAEGIARVARELAAAGNA
jgi:nucleoside-diphosphate-sugar epimerase